MLYVLLYTALVKSILALISDLNCTRVDIMPNAMVKIVYTEKAVICGNKLPDAYCEKIMDAKQAGMPGAAAVAGMDTERPDHCFKDPMAVSQQIKEFTTMWCPKTCGWCCLTPAWNCQNKLCEFDVFNHPSS
ncbi:unnamed protein product [Strongylus vulgaris]|uniref:ShKT domain-containing protein n=1 Tax=Strongylus vulgaris TaxID=40348 RepID=A0A3P7LEH0_STRVU|nr:unnamed protein product [Strongylus vulgaris]